MLTVETQKEKETIFINENTELVIALNLRRKKAFKIAKLSANIVLPPHRWCERSVKLHIVNNSTAHSAQRFCHMCFRVNYFTIIIIPRLL